MKMKNNKMIFSKSGSGNINTRISIPKSYCDKLDITIDDRVVEIVLDEENQQIIIRKKKDN